MARSKKRYLFNEVETVLARKIVFLGGPRQSGKTTLSKILLGKEDSYLNFDYIEDREMILKERLPQKKGLIVFDEIHMYRNWRNYIKGVYDKFGDDLKILVTGSARLDQYRWGGDSLQGRYRYLRLYPLSFLEAGAKSQSDLKDFLNFGPFPEPLLGGNEKEARLWSRDYRNRIVRDDIRDLESIQDLSKLELLLIRLPELIGNPLSINALKEDLQVSHNSVVRWLLVLEKIYGLFKLLPFQSTKKENKLRTVKKETKYYLFDWTWIQEDGIRFENLIAFHLLKWCHFIEDTEGYEMDLRYFRDTDGREVDFVVIKNNNPIMFVEAKLSKRELSSSLKYLNEKFSNVRAVQVIQEPDIQYTTKEGIEVLSAVKFLNDLI